ncbi:hypothetical protein Tco_1345988 [Tanacetum coccineum]
MGPFQWLKIEMVIQANGLEIEELNLYREVIFVFFWESVAYDNYFSFGPTDVSSCQFLCYRLSPPLISLSDNDSLMEEIDLFLADDGSIPPGIESDEDSVDDDTSISLPEFESFYVDYPIRENSTIDGWRTSPRCGLMFNPHHFPSGAKISYPLVEFFVLCCMDLSTILAYRFFYSAFSSLL